MASRPETRVLDDSTDFGPPVPLRQETKEEDDGSIVIPLAQDIPIYNEQAKIIERSKKIKFRKPTGLDLIEVGNPVEFDPISEPPKIIHSTRRMMTMMERLSGVPQASLLKMTPQDLVSCMWALTPFFIPRADI